MLRGRDRLYDLGVARLGGEAGELRSAGRVCMRFGPWRAESVGDAWRVTVRLVRERDEYRLEHGGPYDLRLTYGREWLSWRDVAVDGETFGVIGEPDRL